MTRAPEDPVSPRAGPRAPWAARTAWAALGLCALLGLGLLARELAAPATGPAPVPYDAAACAHCRMLVGDPSFAAQLRDEAGEVRFFDDPGCLLLHLADAAPGAHPAARGDTAAAGDAYVHHLREDRWIPLGKARFVPVPRSPMGYRLGALGPEADEGRSWRQALEALRREGAAAEGHGS